MSSPPLIPAYYECPECKRRHYKGSKIFDEHLHLYEGQDEEELLRSTRIIAGLMLQRVKKLLEDEDTKWGQNDIMYARETREYVQYVIDEAKPRGHEEMKHVNPFIE